MVQADALGELIRSLVQFLLIENYFCLKLDGRHGGFCVTYLERCF